MVGIPGTKHSSKLFRLKRDDGETVPFEPRPENDEKAFGYEAETNPCIKVTIVLTQKFQPEEDLRVYQLKCVHKSQRRVN